MKILLGALLCVGGFMLVPSVQRCLAKVFNMRRQRLSYIAILSIVVLIFAAVPVPAWQWTLGILFIAISSCVIWIVPRSPKVQWWMQEVFFGKNDILDEDAPYSKVVNLFKIPLMGLGFWVIAPWTVIILDIIAIAGAFVWWANSSLAATKEVKKENREESNAADVAVDVSTT